MRREAIYGRVLAEWQVTDSIVRLSLQLGAIVVLGLLGYRFLEGYQSVDSTAASILIGVVFGVATFLQNRPTQRQQHTVQVINEFQSSDRLCEADTWMAHRIARGEKLPVDPEPPEEVTLVVILDYYEFISTLAVRGLVDVPLLLKLRGGTMLRCRQLCEDYIAGRRALVGSELYANLLVLTSAYDHRSSGRIRATVRRERERLKNIKAGKVS
ncbi:MAG: hypothetical protein ACFCVG_15555 [Kineosporiaceae bacterium]